MWGRWCFRNDWKGWRNRLWAISAAKFPEQYPTSHRQLTRSHSRWGHFRALMKLRTCLGTCWKVRKAYLKLLLGAQEARWDSCHHDACHSNHSLKLRKLEKGQRSMPAGNPHIPTAVLASGWRQSAAGRWPPPPFHLPKGAGMHTTGGTLSVTPIRLKENRRIPAVSFPTFPTWMG